MKRSICPRFSPLCIAFAAIALLPTALIGAEPAIEATPESLAAAKYEFSAEDEKLLDAIEKGCFQYFWNEVGKPAMLAKDKTSDTICSTAAVGFELSALPIGVERGWITRQQGEERALTVLRSLADRSDNKKFG